MRRRKDVDVRHGKKGLPIIPINSSLIGKCGSLNGRRSMGMGGAGQIVDCGKYGAGEE
jgi:hypothetical protein